ncbi:MAG: metallophosphoesterase [Opitutales bacterium]|nr:metallophosphoesterase [Opitutales bacterium]MCH8541001.1 metallophosphoesterase [Opitutales bacterium]
MPPLSTLPQASRRNFLKNALATGVVLSVAPASLAKGSPEPEPEAEPRPEGLVDRFAVIGDTHYPRKTFHGTRHVGVDHRERSLRPEPSEIEDRMDLLNDAIAREKRGKGLDFLVHIGDIVHSSGTKEDHRWFQNEILAAHGIPSYVCYGNHDRLEEEDWQDVYGQGRNHAFSRNGFGYIILNSSDTEGARQLCIGQDFLQEHLKAFRDLKGVFLITHIPRFQTGFRGDERLGPSYGSDSPQCDEIMAMLEESPNLICCVSGHFHEHNGIIHNRGIPTVFTNHFGHYGVNQYGLRIFEVYDDGAVFARLEGFEGKRAGKGWQYHYRHSHLYRLG